MSAGHCGCRNSYTWIACIGCALPFRPLDRRAGDPRFARRQDTLKIPAASAMPHFTKNAVRTDARMAGSRDHSVRIPM